MSVTINGGAPSAPQIAEFQSVMQLAAASHTQAISTITGLQTALDAKAPLVSPTFTTPALGTPSSGTLTNCTGLPLAGFANITAQSVLANATGSGAAPTAVALAASQLLGRGSTGNVAAITIGSGLTMTGATLSATGGGSGTVTSVGVSVPTGLSVSGSPVTTTGTIALTLTSGYVIPTQALLDSFLTEDLADEITGTKGTPIGADQIIILDSADGDTPKKAALSSLPSSGGAPSDGDKGDITVTATGTTWTIDAGVVTLSKMANLAQDQVIGRVTASTGVPETFTVTAAARTVLDDTTTGAMLTTLGAQPLDSDLTTIAGLTATTDNFLQAKSSAWASRTVAQVATDLNGTGLVATNLAFRHIPQNSQSTAYTAVASDAGGHILHPAADNNARTFTIPANASVAYPVGAAITFVNQINTVTIAINTDTLVLAGAGTTGSRSLAANGIATAIKIASTTWMISGTGLT